MEQHLEENLEKKEFDKKYETPKSTEKKSFVSKR